jgi:hypothetical protein
MNTNSQPSNSEWIGALKEQGYCHLRRFLPESLTAPAQVEVERLAQAEMDGKTGPRWVYVSAATQPLLDLAHKPPVSDLIEQALGWHNIGPISDAQIAIPGAHSAQEELPPQHHVDGFHDGKFIPFSLLVGVFLSPTPRTFAGNFTVWPGTHIRHERYWREREPSALASGMPRIDVGEPVQLMTDVGDVVLCHYQLAHAAACNTSDVDRVAVYFRVWIGMDHWRQATNLWDGWKI